MKFWIIVLCNKISADNMALHTFLDYDNIYEKCIYLKLQCILFSGIIKQLKNY